jgi:transcriptional regulator with XRE-family HTH domain
MAKSERPARKALSESRKRDEKKFASFGERLRAVRESFGDTQEQLGQLLGCSRAAVSQWESNLTAPSWDKIEAMVERFAVPHDWLMHGRGNTPAAVLQEGQRRLLGHTVIREFAEGDGASAWVIPAAALEGTGATTETVIVYRVISGLDHIKTGDFCVVDTAQGVLGTSGTWLATAGDETRLIYAQHRGAAIEFIEGGRKKIDPRQITRVFGRVVARFTRVI